MQRQLIYQQQQHRWGETLLDDVADLFSWLWWWLFHSPPSLPPQLPAFTRTSIVSRTNKATTLWALRVEIVTILCWSSVVPGGPPHVSSSCFTVNGELFLFSPSPGTTLLLASWGSVLKDADTLTATSSHAAYKKKMMKKVLNGIYIHSTVCITDVQCVFFESERLLSQFQSWLLIFIKGRPFIPCNLTQSNGRISRNALNPWDMLRINSKVHREPRLAFQTKEPRESWSSKVKL